MSKTFTKGYLRKGQLTWDISKVIHGVRWTARLLVSDVRSPEEFKEAYHETYLRAVRLFKQKEDECQTT